jgi:predicted neuraminidase
MVDPMRLVSACVVSGDQGKTWKLSQAIDLGKLGGYGDHAGALEPTVVELRDGRIWMLIRTNKGQFYQAFSTDKALTWSDPAPTPILSPNAPGFLTRLSGGRLALLWNLIDADQASGWRSGEKPTTNQRNRLAIALSEDDGNTWSQPVICAQAKEISYPFLLEPSPGKLLISSGRLRTPELEMDSVVLGISENALLKLAQTH